MEKDKLSIEGLHDITHYLLNTQIKISYLKSLGVEVDFSFNLDSLASLPIPLLSQKLVWKNPDKD